MLAEPETSFPHLIVPLAKPGTRWAVTLHLNHVERSPATRNVAETALCRIPFISNSTTPEPSRKPRRVQPADQQPNSPPNNPAGECRHSMAADVRGIWLVAKR